MLKGQNPEASISIQTEPQSEVGTGGCPQAQNNPNQQNMAQVGEVGEQPGIQMMCQFLQLNNGPQVEAQTDAEADNESESESEGEEETQAQTGA